MTTKELYLVKEAAVIMGISESTLRTVIKRGGVVKRGKFITKNAIEEYLGHSIDNNKPEPMSEPEPEPVIESPEILALRKNIELTTLQLQLNELEAKSTKAKVESTKALKQLECCVECEQMQQSIKEREQAVLDKEQLESNAIKELQDELQLKEQLHTTKVTALNNRIAELEAEQPEPVDVEALVSEYEGRINTLERSNTHLQNTLDKLQTNRVIDKFAYYVLSIMKARSQGCVSMANRDFAEDMLKDTEKEYRKYNPTYKRKDLEKQDKK